MALEEADLDLKVTDIGVSLSGTEIIKKIGLKVQDRQFVGVIGPNGCGKSTLLKSIYKVLKPHSGTVLLDEMDVLRASTKTMAKKTAVVGQFNELGFDFSVWEMVSMGRAPHKKFCEPDTPHDAQLIQDALEKVALASYAARSFLSLSGGEKQRVVLARALVQQPQLLVLDEPTNHLDIKYQIQVLSIVKKLQVSTLAALHDLELAARYCDYLYVMKRGRIVAQGKPEKVLQKEMIERVYEIDCEIYTNPITGKRGIAYL